jgi:putative endonuclease
MTTQQQAWWCSRKSGESTKGGFVYILAGQSGVQYTGVTHKLDVRMVQHRAMLVLGFTNKYKVTRLVHYDLFPDIRAAIACEKPIKGWLRSKKIALIESTNPRGGTSARISTQSVSDSSAKLAALLILTLP